MGRRIAVVMAGLVAALGVVRSGLSDETKMYPPEEFPHAGVSVEIPVGFTAQLQQDLGEILRASQTENKRMVRSIVLMGLPVGPQDTPDTIAKNIIANVRGDLAFTHVMEKVLPSQMPMGGTKGPTRMLNYTFRGHKYLAAQIVIIREMEDPKLRLAYVLNIEVATSHRQGLVQLLGEMTKGIKMIPLRRPATLPVERFGQLVQSRERGFSISVPHGWHANMAKEGLMMGQVDYVLGRMTPVMRVIVEDVGPVTTARERADQLLKAEMDYAQKGGAPMNVISVDTAKLDDTVGHQMLATQTIPPRGEKEGTPQVVIWRLVCRDNEDKKTRMSYLLRLTCNGDDTKAGEEIMEKLAGEFRFVSASQPATLPAAQPETAPAPAPAEKK